MLFPKIGSLIVAVAIGFAGWFGYHQPSQPLTFQSSLETNVLGTATGSGSFPTSSLNNFQDGDTINSGDWNALERKIGKDKSSDQTSLDWMLRASTSTDPGHLHSINVSTGTITGLSFTNATGTNLTATNLLDVSGNKYATSTFVPISWYVQNETSSSKDAGIFVFRTTSTIKDFWAGNNSSGSVSFNVGLTTNTSNATSTWRKLFTSNQTVASVTSTQLTINGSSTASAGDILGYFSVSASSTAFYFTTYFTSP